VDDDDCAQPGARLPAPGACGAAGIGRFPGGHPEADLEDEHDGPAELAQASEQARALNRCLQRLDGPQREAVVLAYLQDLSHAELAARLRVPLGTIKSWIRRGLEKLRACLEATP
jgi:RNA polymerase sigma-70 factor (ECF subfamily)